MRLILIFVSCLIAMGCSGAASSPNSNVNAAKNTNSAKSGPAPVYGYEVVKSYPHDEKAFTQGLLFHNGFLYESTGQEGESTIRKVELETGKVIQKIDLPDDNFGEGLALHGGKLYNLTWRDGICRVYDVNDLKMIREFTYQGEGWGLASDGTNLFMTDSTHVIRVMNPDTFKSVRMVPVMRDDGRPLMAVNELEFVKGELWANVWHSERPETLGKANYIARIDPASGRVVGWIDLGGISPADQSGRNSDGTAKDENTLNGIAYDPATDRIWVTGKNWKKLYEIKVTGPKS